MEAQIVQKVYKLGGPGLLSIPLMGQIEFYLFYDGPLFRLRSSGYGVVLNQLLDWDTMPEQDQGIEIRRASPIRRHDALS